jgi:hypothetical protein
MDRRQVLTAAGVAAVAAATPATARGEDEDSGRHIVGSWFGTVTATNPPLGQFNDVISFHSDGVVTESRRYLVEPTPIGNLLQTTAHGAWRRRGGDKFEAFFRLILQNADTGAPIGTDNVRLSLTLNRAAGTLTGTFVAQLKDSSDALLLQVVGDYSATPITV